MASIVSSLGLGSGIDIGSMVSQLVAAEKTPVSDRFDKKETDIQAKITALGTFKSALSDFRTSVNKLSSAGSLTRPTTTSSDSSILTASASSNADLGSYRLEVKQLAQSHAVASTIKNTPNDAVGTGTLTIKFGTYQSTGGATTFTQNADKGTLSLNIDSSNNSLSGIRDAINKADAGVSAAIVYTGTGYQLVLNSEEGGAKNAMQITGIGALQYDGGGVTDTLAQTQAAQDAKVSINGLDVTSTTNTISTALKGVTLNLLKAQVGTTVTVGVNRDTESIKTTLDSFVTAYNDLASTVKEVSAYDSTKTTQSALLGDSAVLGAMARIRSELSRSVSGLSGNYKSLFDIGLSTQADGTLNLNSTKLDSALSTDATAVAAIFSLTGRPTNASSAEYISATESTTAGSYGISVTQAATQGKLTGQTALTFPISLDETNNTFALSVDNVSSGLITLTQGNYTDADSLITEIQSRINGNSSLRSAGSSVSVGLDSSNNLVITSKTYGSSSGVSITQGNALLGLVSGSGSTAGTDIAGTIDGAAAEGSGQTLKSIAGNSNGLEVLITDNNVGDKGGIEFSRGILEHLDNVLDGILGSNGSLAAKTDGWNKTLDNITDDRKKLEDRMSALSTRLTKQFTLMDKLVGQLQSTSSYLSQQLAGLTSSSK